jgi:predicted protein tyrosine phosphatase
MWWKKNKEEDPRKEIKSQLRAICDNAKVQRDTLVTTYADTVSLVCFVNADIPSDRKIIHVGECIAEYFFFIGQRSVSQDWYERHKNSGKKDKIICFEIPAEDMSALYHDHLRVLRESGKSPFHTVSAVAYGGKSYPMSFCLGLLWGKQLTPYKKYDSFSL